MKRLSSRGRNSGVLRGAVACVQCESGQVLRCGFTLMETLVALGLCGLIVASVGTSLQMYWRFSTLSRERITASQVQRGVVEDLTSDLRTAVPLGLQNATPSQLPESLSARRPESSGSPEVGTAMFLSVTEQMLNLISDNRQPIHFFGSVDALAIFTEHNNPRFAAHSAGSDRGVRRQHVVWWVHDGRSLRLPLSAIGPRAEFTSLTANDVASGLVRAERPFGQTRNSGRDAPPLLISADVTALRLRYFDGTEWLSEWDSLSQVALPEAVEIQLTFRDQPSSPQRFVIYLPQADRRR